MEPPVHFADVGTARSLDALAWLRFVTEKDGKGIRAALFQTTAQGEPLDFCFTRAYFDEAASQQEAVHRRDVAFMARSLFGAAKTSTTVVLALDKEMPPGILADELAVRLPVCRVVGRNHIRRDCADGGHTDVEVLWEAGHPEAGSPTRQLIERMMDGGDLMEPFDRAAKGLAEAFADERIKELAAVPGLSVVVSLCSLPSPSELSCSPRYRSPVGHVREPSSVPRADLTLAERLWALLAVPPRLSRNPDSPLSWPGELMAFQKDGVRALLANDRLLLADDMGLGKTVQAVAALRILRVRGEVGSCLVAAPASLLDQWRRELAKWAPELSAIIIRGGTTDRDWQWRADVDVTLISYDTLRADSGSHPRASLRRKTWDVVIADEAQRIKNRNDTSDALKGLRRRRSWALTGTPIENHEEELASILEFVDHDDTGSVRRYYPGVRLQARHRELQVRRKKAEVLADLPPKRTTKVTIELTSRQRNSYDKAEREGIVYLRSLGAEVGIEHVLSLITRLKQICNADPKTGESSKLSDIRERLEQLATQGHKALVFSQYTNDTSGVGAVAEYLREFKPLTFTGDMTVYEREAVIQRFKASSEHRALVLSLRAGGLGLNLQEASYVFHLDRWWNPAVETQAEDRSHRMGQPVKVNVIKYSCTGTIEQRIDVILERKQKLFDELVDDVSLDLSAQMTREELLGLFGLEPVPD